MRRLSLTFVIQILALVVLVLASSTAAQQPTTTATASKTTGKTSALKPLSKVSIPPITISNNERLDVKPTVGVAVTEQEVSQSKFHFTQDYLIAKSILDVIPN